MAGLTPSDVVVFLDDGGVMNDNRLRSGQWQRLVAEFFVPRLGGTPAAWADANRVVAERLLEPVAWQARLQVSADFASFDRGYQLDWIGGMCEIVGVRLPPEDECMFLAREGTHYVISRVRSAFPGAIDAILTLHSRGQLLHTASGGSSSDLAAYLEGMGVRHCFGRLYGPDLIDTFKASPTYYERVFDDAGVSPRSALVVDDSPAAIAWAASVGARTVLVSAVPRPDVTATAVITSLAELPKLIQRL